MAKKGTLKCGRCNVPGLLLGRNLLCHPCGEEEDAKRLAALRCRSACTLGHGKANRIDVEFDRLAAVVPWSVVREAERLAFDDHQDRFGCDSNTCRKYGA